MPATWLNYAVGLMRMRAGSLALANAPGAMPRTFMYAALGGSLTQASPIISIVSLVLFVELAMLGAVAALAGRRALRAAATPLPDHFASHLGN
jgi:uncharacterized membrane protein YdjX (TVP38/TMEM64 family)